MPPNPVSPLAGWGVFIMMDDRRKHILMAIENLAQAIVPKGAVVLLFGSQARGDSHEGSDWDLLILLDKGRVALDDYDNLAYPFRELGWKLGEIINPILYTVGDWKKQSHTPFYKNVENDGIRLWH